MNDIKLPRLGDDTPSDRPQRKWEEFFYPRDAPERPAAFDLLLAEKERHAAFMAKAVPDSIPYDDARRQMIAAGVKLDGLVESAKKTRVAKPDQGKALYVDAQTAEIAAQDRDAAKEEEALARQRAWVDKEIAARDEKIRLARERRELEGAAREGLAAEGEEAERIERRADRLADAMGKTMRQATVHHLTPEREAARQAELGAAGPGPGPDPNMVEAEGSTVRAPVLVSALDLYRKKFPPISWVIDGFLAAGTLSILAGKPKIGKSFLALQAGLAIARGDPFLGMATGGKGAPVWYLGLEDGERRLNYRITGQLGAGVKPPSLLGVSTWWPRMGPGSDGLGWMKRVGGEIGFPRLIVIDTLARFRAKVSVARAGTAYESQYDDLEPLLEFCTDTGTSVLLIHHLNKGGIGDPFDKISGSVALQGAVDAMMVLDRDRVASATAATLSVQARDFEGFEVALEFEKVPCTWKSMGPAVEVRISAEHELVFETIRVAGGACETGELASALGKAREATKKVLQNMAKAGLLRRSGSYNRASWSLVD